MNAQMIDAQTMENVDTANAVFMTKVAGFAKNLIEKVEVHIHSKSYSTD